MGIEVALMAASTALGAMNALNAADAAEAQAQSQKQQADYNANIASLQAKDAVNRGNIDTERQRVKAQQVLAAQRAAMGASGVETESGSFASVLLDTATTGEQDAQTIRTNAMREAWGFENQVAGFNMAGDAALAAGDAKAAQLRTEALGTVLTGASKIGSKMGWFDTVSPTASSGTGLKMPKSS